ncbi:MAG: hypothetical protein AAF568_03505, partial [Pseudomonadota bacterium]
MSTIGGFLLGLSDASIWVALYGAVFLYFLFLYGDLYKQTRREEERPDGTVKVIDPRAEMVLSLRIGSRSGRYNAFLGGFLDWLDRQFAAREIKADNLETDPEKQAQAEARNRKPWSYGLLDFTLMMAVAYPVLTLFVQWAVTGDPGFLGSLPVFPADQRWWLRWGVLSLVFIAILMRLLFAANWKLKLGISADEPINVFPWLVNASILGVTGAFLFVAEGAISLGAAAASTAASAVSGTFAIRVLTTIAVGFVVTSAFGVLITSAAAASLFVFLLVFRTRSGMNSRKRLQKSKALTQISVLFAGILVAASLVNAETPGARVALPSMLLFFGLLPILNALADFASIGLTRYLLRKGIESRVYLWAPVDLILGLAVFALLGT